MPTDLEQLDRIADALEDIALAFLGPREAFLEVNGTQLSGVIGKVLAEIWKPVEVELKKFPAPTGTFSTFDVAGSKAPRSIFPGVGNIFAPGVFDSVFTVLFNPRPEARLRLRKLLPPVQAEIGFLEAIQSNHPENFGPDQAQEVYLDVRRRTKDAATQIRQGLLGVADFLAPNGINFEIDPEFTPIKTALEKLTEEKVEEALTPAEGGGGGGAPRKPKSDAQRKS